MGLQRPWVRALAVGAGIGLAVVAITQLVLPGSSGPGRGTPVAVLFTGLVSGALGGLMAVGLVLVYRTTRVVNFAQAAFGAFGAVFTYNMSTVHGLPYGLTLAAGVVVAAVLAMVTELLVLRRFFTAPRLVATIVTVAVASLVANRGVPIVSFLPIWGEQRDLAEIFGASDVAPVPGFSFQLGDLPLPFGFVHLMALVLVAFIVTGLGAFLRFTRMGTAIRASAENTERAELLGINVRMLSTVVWTIAGALSGVAVIVLATMENFSLAGRGAPDVLIAALAAAVIARMRSLPVAVYAAVLIAVLQESVGWSYRDQGALVEAALVLVIAAGLLLARRGTARSAEGSSWEATDEVRAVPPQLMAVGGVRVWRRGLVAAGAAAVLVFPWTTTSGQVNRGSLAAIYAIVILSLVVLTGWAGQVSLGQFALVAVGALTGGALTSRAGLSFWLSLLIGAVVTGLVALVLALPALRIRGLFLGIVTFAFAGSAGLVLFEDRYFGWLQPENIRRPTLMLLDFEDERSMYYLCLVFLAVAVAVVLAMRRGRTGRVLVALRNNENDLQAFGVNVVRTKLMAFGLGGIFCGVAGVLFAHHQRAVDQSAFVAQASIEVFMFAVIGGIASVTGAVLGAGLYAAFQLIPIGDPILSFLFDPGFGVLLILFVAPAGVASLVYAVRDAALRIVAQRRQIVVPSLFADVDPADLEQQLVPLASAEEGRERDVLAPTPYRLSSVLYGNGLSNGEPASEERAVLQDLAERLEEEK